MTIVDTTKFVIGVVFALGGVAMLVVARREGGFGQRRQAGALMLVAAVILIAVGIGAVTF